MNNMRQDPSYSLENIYSKNPNLSIADRKLIKKAYDFAKKIHGDQKRKSGNLYFFHLVQVAKKLATLGMDGIVISAGLLHGSIKKKVSTKKELKEIFGGETLFLVDGVTRLGKLQYRGMDRHNESLRKLFVATSKDLRVLIIKFANRLHDLETLEFIPAKKQKRIAKETLEIYAQLAYRLGMSRLSKELGNLAFSYAKPKEYKKVKKLLDERSKENEKNLERSRRSITKKIVEAGIKDFKISYRKKGIVSLYKKLVMKKWEEEKIYDILALRIIVPSVESCYKTLGVIHENFRPLPGRIKDFIAIPKTNGYRSIHTTILTGHGGVLEVQIRTNAMHQEAEYGAASHLGYKAKTVGVDGLNGSKDWVSKIFDFIKPAETKNKSLDDEKPKWIDDLAKCSIDSDNSDFQYNLKEDFFSDRIFVFTPIGEVVDLPVGATPIDFAFHIHSHLGETAIGARINNIYKSLDTILKNGDVIEIDSKKGATPNKKWLTFIKTSIAKRRIRLFLENKDK